MVLMEVIVSMKKIQYRILSDAVLVILVNNLTQRDRESLARKWNPSQIPRTGNKGSFTLPPPATK